MTPCTCSEAAFVGDGSVTRRAQPQISPALASFSRRLARRASPNFPRYLIFSGCHLCSRHRGFSKTRRRQGRRTQACNMETASDFQCAQRRLHQRGNEPQFSATQTGLVRLQKIMDEYVAGVSSHYTTNEPSLIRGLELMTIFRQDLDHLAARDTHELLRCRELVHEGGSPRPISGTCSTEKKPAGLATIIEATIQTWATPTRRSS